MTDLPLTGRRVALLETREAERLEAMLREQGADVVSCPAVGIVDLPDPAPVLAWLDRFIAQPCDDLILLTGEGLIRLHALARQAGKEEGFLAALARPRRITRGPKPARALRSLGLQPELRAETPTTEGIIAVLEGLPLQGRRVGVQLYPGAPDRLCRFLKQAGAIPDPVTPYEYAPNTSDEAVAALIDQVLAGRIDAIAFTSAAQVRRIYEVAQASGRQNVLLHALRAITVAAVGPVVAAEIERYGLSATVVPRDAYFMKPLVTALAATLGQRKPG
jgi:uroporphyrinogen-III synthase